MQRKSFDGMLCPIARGLDRVGEWWSMLILRDAFHGLTRFDQFEASLGIAPNMLARRLTALVEDGLLEKRLYNERPPRHEYILTDRGRDFLPVLLALSAWGEKHFSPEGPASIFKDPEDGHILDPVVVDRATGMPLTADTVTFAAGPAADEPLRRRMAWVERKRLARVGG